MMEGMIELTVEKFFEVANIYEDKKVAQNTKQLRPLNQLKHETNLVSGTWKKPSSKMGQLVNMYFDEIANMNWTPVVALAKTYGITRKKATSFSRNLALLANMQGYKLNRRTVYEYEPIKRQIVEIRLEKN